MNIGSNANKRIKTFLTPEDLAVLLAVSKTTIYRLVVRRQIPFYKIGGSLRFRQEDIERFLESGRIGPIEI
jgi:excisionase family DNA binding protein